MVLEMADVVKLEFQLAEPQLFEPGCGLQVECRDALLNLLPDEVQVGQHILPR
jgi:hypothetical protein